MNFDNVKIILIRHGQSLGNANNLYLGHTNLDLSEKGIEQAEIAAQYFKDFDIEAIYSSDLLRAYNTALPHAKLHGLEIILSKDLREVFLGEWESLPLDKLKTDYYHEFEEVWHGEFGTSTPPGGESVLDASKRMYAALLKIAKSHDGIVLVAAHGGVIRGFWCLASGLEPSEWARNFPFPTNASASFVAFDGEKLIPIKYSFDEYFGNTDSRPLHPYL